MRLPRSGSRPAARRLGALAAALLLAGSLGACGATGTGTNGYYDGSGVITRLDLADRYPVGEVSGTTLTDDPIALTDFAGKVVVVNVWGSWCPPCRAETDKLAQAAAELKSRGVVFLGINTRDASRATALSFQRAHSVPYPSIFDPGGRTLLAFHGVLTPNAIPSTVVVDREGRVAASILGEVTSARTLVDLVSDVETEQP